MAGGNRAGATEPVLAPVLAIVGDDSGRRRGLVGRGPSATGVAPCKQASSRSATLTLAVPNLGPHATLLAADLASTFSCLLVSHTALRKTRLEVNAGAAKRPADGLLHARGAPYARSSATGRRSPRFPKNTPQRAWSPSPASSRTSRNVPTPAGGHATAGCRSGVVSDRQSPRSPVYQNAPGDSNRWPQPQPATVAAIAAGIVGRPGRPRPNVGIVPIGVAGRAIFHKAHM